MKKIKLSLLRGVCQMPAYVAQEKGYFKEAGLDVEIEIQPTAWMVPERLDRGDVQFAVIPWTRVAAGHLKGDDMVLVSGSGYEEAAVVVRKGMSLDDVKTVAVPQPGGIKDLTASVLMKSLGWDDKRKVRFPSGDGAILCLVGQGADAAAMVEPYATMMEMTGVGTVVRRTGELWPGSPGCSLTTTQKIIDHDPELVQAAVGAYVRGSRAVDEDAAGAARVGHRYIGASPEILQAALGNNSPNLRALDDDGPRNTILDFMKELGYLDRRPEGYLDLSFLHKALAG